MTIRFANDSKDVLVIMFFKGWDAERFTIVGDDSVVSDDDLQKMSDMEVPEGWREIDERA